MTRGQLPPFFAPKSAPAAYTAVRTTGFFDNLWSIPFLLLFPALSFAQELHTFENRQAADAYKINQNLNYALENASGGCSATQ